MLNNILVQGWVSGSQMRPSEGEGSPTVVSKGGGFTNSRFQGRAGGSLIVVSKRGWVNHQQSSPRERGVHQQSSPMEGGCINNSWVQGRGGSPTAVSKGGGFTNSSVQARVGGLKLIMLNNLLRPFHPNHIALLKVINLLDFFVA